MGSSFQYLRRSKMLAFDGVLSLPGVRSCEVRVAVVLCRYLETASDQLMYADNKA